MKKRIILLSLVIVSIFLLIYIFNSNKTIDIYEVISSKEYSYLPEVAQDYIIDIFKETGQLIKTEKNKELNEPYLNPNYIDYLKLSLEEKENANLIPNVYKVDYVYSGKYNDVDFPSYYNLSNISNKSYVSPVKNQGSLGTCWAFATLENAESFLMVTKNEEYSSNSEQFSVRQLDYAASTNGIFNYENPNAIASLSEGGNFLYAISIMSKGLSLVDESVMPYNESLEQKKMHEIFNYSNSRYEVNSSVELPSFGKLSVSFVNDCLTEVDSDSCLDEKNEALYQEYLKTIKNGIMNYGGIYLGAYDPTGTCGLLNSDGNYVLNPNTSCFPVGNNSSAKEAHAMQIIGWDDNYNYEYCRVNQAYHSASSEECKSRTIIKGQGAFILQNSWGEEHTAHPYLTYESIMDNYVSFGYITSLSPMQDRNWDNVYSLGQVIGNILLKKISSSFINDFNNNEQIKKIKFQASLPNQTYKISITVNDENYIIDEKFETEYPGLYTIDISDYNIIINNSNFTINIENNNNVASIFDRSVSVFTKNLDNSPLIKTSDTADIYSNSFTIYSETRNIKTNSIIDYKLYDENNNYLDILDVQDNLIGTNNTNSKIRITQKINPGTYRLVQNYTDAFASTTLNVISVLEGSGTIEDPYIITSENELRSISQELDKYYVLNNDIVLTSDWVPIGTLDNPFSGGLDGNNHKIINLNVDNESLNYAGLFGYVSVTNNKPFYVKNLYLENALVKANTYAGLLIGGINTNFCGEDNAVVDGIYLINGQVEANYASALIANITGNYTIKISNIYSSATVKGKNFSSLIRFENLNALLSKITNIENTGIMYDYSNNGYNSSLISTDFVYNYSLSNYISIGYSIKDLQEKEFYDTPIVNISESRSFYGYSLTRENSSYTFETNFKTLSSIKEFTNKNKYIYWDKFDTYWKIENINNILRIPLLKNLNLNYTQIDNNIDLSINDFLTLSEIVLPSFSTNRITVNDNDFINIDYTYENGYYPNEINIYPLKTGKTSINIVSDYDGYDSYINLRIYKPNPVITYHNEEQQMNQQANNFENTVLNNNIFTKEGYVFDCWNTKIDGTGEKYEENAIINELLDDLDLYAQWKMKGYVITFNSNDENENIIKQNTYANESTLLNKNSFIKEGYEFINWNTKKDGSGITYEEESLINIDEDITLYAQWKKKQIFSIDNFNLDKDKGYISNIDINTDLDTFKNSFFIENGYFIEVDYKTYDNKNVLYTGGYTKILKNNEFIESFINVVSGDTNGDGKINYLDYVSVYNHIQKEKHPDVAKKLLNGAYLCAADMSNDNKISYLDYVRIYNKIKELKGGINS